MNSLQIFAAETPRVAAEAVRLPSLLRLACLAALLAMPATGPTASAKAAEAEDQPVREIFVPFDALSGILGGENERVFMTREEYLALEKESRQKPPTLSPQAVVLLSAGYDGTIREGIAVVRGQVEIEVLNPGLHAVPLSLEGVALRAATLDGAMAPVARNAQGQIVLFVRDAGRRRLEVELQVPVVITAAQQSLQFRVPTAGSSTLKLAVPGNVEVKSGAQVVDRQYDATADQTRFELLAPDGGVTVVMSLNNRRLREDRVVLARSVLVSELTTSYERLHATVEMNVLHGAVDRFLFDVPQGFQVTRVDSPLLSQWIIRKEAGHDVLEVPLREPTRGIETVNIAATRTPVAIGPWSMPTLQPRDVAGQVAVIGLLAEVRMRPLSVTADQLIRIDTSVLRSALPESVFEAEPGAPEIRPIAAFYAPGDAHTLSAAFEAPRDALRVATHLLLSLSEEQQTLRGGFTLTPQAAKQTAFAFRMPGAWQLQRVYGAEQQALTYDRYQSEAETRYVVTLPTAVEPGASLTVYFDASYRSSAWLGDWTSLDVEFPRIAVEQATDASGAIAVQPAGDLTAKPVTIEGLAPLDANQRGRFGLAESANELTYQVSADTYRGVFRVERTRPRISTRNYSFFGIRAGLLHAHYELVYVIERAHANRLELELPATTPTALSIQGLDNVTLKEYSHTAQNGKHVWTVLLATAQTGTVRLAVDFQQRIGEADAASLTLPLIRAVNVAYQTQMVSVEGDPALDIDMQTAMRRVDVGELAEAQETPGRQLLGAFASTADDDAIQVKIARRDLSALPAAVVERAELVTLVSQAGVSQSAARYLLQTKVPFLAIRFPEDADLWSVSLNGASVKPRRRGDQIVLSLQTDRVADQAGLRRRDLQVVYEAPVSNVSWVGEIRTHAPQLWLIQDEQDTGVAVPQVDLVWYLHLPTGYRVSRVHGTVFPRMSDLQPVRSPWQVLAQAGATVGGGMPGPFLPRALRSRQQVAGKTAKRSAEADRARGGRGGESLYSGDDGGVMLGAATENEGQPPERGRRWRYGGVAEISGPPVQASDAAPEEAKSEAPLAAEETIRAAAPQVAKYWALQGLHGLSIQIDQSDARQVGGGSDHRTQAALEFRSLGTDPELDITVYQQSRMIWLAWAVVLAILVAGLMQTHRRVRTRLRWVVVLALLACGLPIIGGPLTEFNGVFEKALLAVLAWIPLWIVIACVERVTSWIRRWAARSALLPTSAVLIILLSVLTSLASVAEAQDIRALLKPILDEDHPVRIPDDAVVIPYDPADSDGRATATKVLVPYARYVELWNQAHPDQRIGDQRPEQPFSCAGASYTVTLAEGEHVVLQGTLAIELFTDNRVDVPLALQQGVITSALLDGKPARLKAVQPAPAAPQQQEAQPAPNAPAPGQGPALPPSLLTLLVEGKGRHRLELTIRIAVTRQGGSRIVGATIPYAEATAVQVTVPEVGTNVHRRVGTTVLSETTTETQQTIDATLNEGGRLEIMWRAKITPGAVDQALTTTSLAVVDVREDGIHVTWRMDFAFGQTDRSTFRLEVPRDYLVELVEGKNVRGWDMVTEGERNFLNVELLTAVKQSEQITVHLSRRMVFSLGEATTLRVPFVAVPDAALHRGTVQIRRSTILELQTGEDQGVSRTDGANVAEQIAGAAGGFGSPLSVRDYQAYKFTATPFQIALVVSQIRPQVSAELRTLFRLGETEAAVESEVQILAQQRSVYQVRIDIPEDLELEQVAAAGLSDWSIATSAGRRTLTTFFSTGQTNRFSISLRGKLSDHQPEASVPLPKIVVRDVDRQHGTLVVQVDTSLEARATVLENCRPTLLQRVTDWLAEAQQSLARLALEYEGADYRGAILLSPRAPVVTCVTVTNVRVTFREIQETILLDFRIAEAGVRQLTFRLPASLQDAHLSAPRVREKSVVPVEGESYVRVTLELQDAITGNYRVVVEHDHAIAPDRQLAPLPLVDVGTTHSRYVTLENAGRDEVVVEGTPGMEAVTPQSRQWEQLAARLSGGGFATAYVTAQTGPEAEFGYRTKQREIVKTAGASIGLARTELVLDASGAYRASLVLKVDNRTEPYLEIELPPHAMLWTAHVDSQPVKPARTTGQANDRLRRIPLRRTAEGDLDYPVVLKYAGKFDGLRTLRAVDVPVIRTVNINVELSQVKLYLPDDFQWVHFEGTATPVQGEDDFAAGYMAYRTQQVEKLTQIIRGSNEFSKSRAISNVKILEEEFEGLQADGRVQTGNTQLRTNFDTNARALEAATQEIQQRQQSGQVATDNRERLHEFFGSQYNGLARNEAARLGRNFDLPARIAAPEQAVERFDQQWLDKGLKAEGEIAGKPSEAAETKPMKKGKGELADRLQDDKSGRAQQLLNVPFDDRAAQQVFQGQPAQTAQRLGEMQQQLRQPALQSTKENLNRAYVDKIERQAAQQAGAAGGVVATGPTSGERGQASQSHDMFMPKSETRTRLGLAQRALLAGGAGRTVVQVDQVVGRAGLASLDFDLPQRGTAYYFTTPRGNVEISARPINSRLLKQLANFAGLVALVIVALVLWWVVQTVAVARRGRIVTAVLLCIAGPLLIVLGTLPVCGIVMILGGILLLLGNGRHVAPQAAA